MADADEPIEDEDATMKEVREEEARLRKEIERWPYNEAENGMMWTHMLLILFGLNMTTSWESPVPVRVIAILLGFGSYIIPHSKRYIYIEGSRDTFTSWRWPKKKIRTWYRKNDPTFGVYAVGGDLGLACLILWALWCILLCDSDGTSRPSWPWLDFLG